MKNVMCLLFCLAFTNSVLAASWSDSLKGMLNSSDSEENEPAKEAPAMDTTMDTTAITGSLADMVSSQLGVSQSQAEGGLGSLFELAQSTLGSQDFSQLSQYVPEMDTLLSAAPAVADAAGGLGGLLGKDAEKYTSALGAGAKAYQQFDKLGLGAEKVPQYMDVTKQFLNSKGGKDATDLFVKGVANML